MLDANRSWHRTRKNSCNRWVEALASRSLSFSSILPRPRGYQRNVYRLKLKLWLVSVRGKICLGRFQPILVIPLRKIRFIVRAARLVPQGRPLGDHPRKLQHVIKLTGEYHGGVGPLGAVAEIDLPEPLEHLAQFTVGLLQALVVANHGAVLGHQLAQLAP